MGRGGAHERAVRGRGADGVGQHLARDVVVDQLVLLRVEVALDARDDALGELGVLAVRVGDEDRLGLQQGLVDAQPRRAHRGAGLDEVDDRIGDAQTARRLDGAREVPG